MARTSYSIDMYDMEDNYIMGFDSYKQCADYFKTTPQSISSSVCKVKNGKYCKKRDAKNNRWVKLYKMDYEEDEREDL